MLAKYAKIQPIRPPIAVSRAATGGLVDNSSRKGTFAFLMIEG
jgi:hypothetical protein